MPVIVWDKVGDRIYETGLDRGVLYLPDGSAVPWNGLTSIIENFDRETVPVYYDGMKISDLVSLGDFSATMKAVTYPEEFVEIEGAVHLRSGLFVNDQHPQTFCLCYRTQISNDAAGDVVGYKIHIIYNLIAIPSQKTYASLTEDPSLMEFEWNITAIPEEVPGFRPTAHIVINTLDIDPWLLEDIEKILYGSSDVFAALIPMPDLIRFINDWYRVKIIDNGDGTWTARSKRNGFINFLSEDLFQILYINARYLDDHTFVISDTLNVTDVPKISITNNGDGTWTASTDHEGLINVTSDGVFEILNANAVFLGQYNYSISDTAED